MSSKTTKISLRVSDALLERIDRLTPALEGRPELTARIEPTRSDVLRLALARGVAELEQELDVEDVETDET
jgi:predicted transcriptional regulator